MPQHDDNQDDLAALYIAGAADESGSDDQGGGESTALDFSVAHDDDSPESAYEAFQTYAPAEAEEAGTELGAIHSAATEAPQGEDEAAAFPLFTVTNPPETVSVSAAIDGRIERVDVSPKLTGMSEAQLRDEILVIAELARQQGLAGQHTYLLESAFVSEISGGSAALDRESREGLREFMESGENGLGLPSPEQADAAQAEVFTTRYAGDRD